LGGQALMPVIKHRLGIQDEGILQTLMHVEKSGYIMCKAIKLMINYIE
jgi:hypothetical protein